MEGAETVHVKTDTADYTLKGHMCELSAFAFVPTKRDNPPERTVFNSVGKIRHPESTYDRLFPPKLGFDNKLHRCDREHAKLQGLTVNEEENSKVVPTLSSSVYGHRMHKSYDKQDRAHVRIALVKAEFFRRNGIPYPEDKN
ncbi:uncharacterized protein C5orf49 homolog [Gigantopelta aegis]|uniref:uncharacterized protein C5orf49 homolog n=1 Tax=Gigantopelta aegis TaxID=1735272 RepID=UPI001B88CF48|nr:uncharacterized protein C5orf49 homolog [Gigantopelta aegis]